MSSVRFLALMSVAMCPLAGHTGDKTWAPIQITWHGQSFFEIKSSKGTNIVTDPHNIPEYGRLVGIKADAIVISHNHNDHTQVAVVENHQDKNIRVLAGLKGFGPRASFVPIDEKIKDVQLRSVSTFHDDMEGLKYGRNAVFVIDMDGWRVVFLGDLGHILTPEQVKRIGPVDVLMIPVGGIYTLNGSEAKKVVAQLKPKEYIFPMHHGTKVYEDLLPVTEFLEDQPRANVTSSKENTITLNRDAQRPRPLIVQLHYWGKNKKD